MEPQTQHLDTERSGNINLAKGEKKFRNWTITCWNEIEAENLKKLNYKYIIMGNEICPTTGKKHWQSFITLENATTKSSLIKQGLPTTYITPSKGSAKQNSTYCSKMKNIYFEDGIKPYSRLSCEDLKKMSYEDIINFDARCSNAYIKAKTILENDIDIEDWKKSIKVYYIQGPSGIGKTEKAKEIIRQNKDKYGTKINRIKYENSFYLGIGNAKIAIYDEFRDSHMKASEFINLIDYNKQTMNTKGGEKNNNYELIIITTVQKITDIYHNMIGEPRKQWERRIEVIDMYEEDFLHNSIELHGRPSDSSTTRAEPSPCITKIRKARLVYPFRYESDIEI